MLKSDLYTIVQKCVSGELSSISPEYHSDRHSVAVVTVSKGYPGSYKKGLEITGNSIKSNIYFVMPCHIVVFIVFAVY